MRLLAQCIDVDQLFFVAFYLFCNVVACVREFRDELQEALSLRSKSSEKIKVRAEVLLLKILALIINVFAWFASEIKKQLKLNSFSNFLSTSLVTGTLWKDCWCRGSLIRWSPIRWTDHIKSIHSTPSDCSRSTWDRDAWRRIAATQPLTVA